MEKGTAGSYRLIQTRIRWPMGENLVHETLCTYLLNKPAGVISADWGMIITKLSDPIGWDSHVTRKSLPVGRLDIDTHGLLLTLTNNGKLAHAMLSPKSMCRRFYSAQVAGIMDEADVACFEAQALPSQRFHDFACEIADLRGGWDKCQFLCRNWNCRRKIPSGQAWSLPVAKEVVDLERISMGPQH